MTVGPGARTPTLDTHSRLALVERGAVSRRLLRPLIAASLFSLIVPVVASAAPAGDVSIRVEGSSATLAGPAVVRTVDGAFTKVAASGPPASCPSTSIGGALETLTTGGWNGSNGSVGMSLETILGETHLFTSDAYWNLFVNDAPASMGICTQQVSPGDRVLIAPSCTGADTPTCFSGDPLELAGPATAPPGSGVTLHADEYTVTFGTAPDFINTTAPTPSAGATVTGAGQTVATDAAGNAAVTLAATAGPQVFTVTKGDRVRGTAVVCATTGSDGACGPRQVQAGVGPSATCATNGHDGKCGTADRTPPYARISTIRNGQRFGKGHGPRALTGSVAVEPAGLRSLRLRLTRSDHGRCSTYDATKERFVRTKRCSAAAGRTFAIGTAQEFSYLLPRRLGRGRYVLDVFAVDGAGNRGTLTRGQSRVVFHVR